MKKVKKNLKSSTGITLIALVITIIVLLILAGIAISMLTGDNGILNQAVKAKKETELGQEKEMISLYSLSEQEVKLGTSLADRSLDNGENWHVIYKKDSGKEYGTGWNYVPAGTEIPEYGETNHNWVVNYKTGEIIDLGEKENYEELDVKSTVGVTDNMVLNIDASNLKSDNWGDGVVKHGNVKYDAESNAISFNQEGDKEGDYLELTKPGNFSNGFTFEIYMNLDELFYEKNDYTETGLFCKVNDLSSAQPWNYLRFYQEKEGGICRLSTNQASKDKIREQTKNGFCWCSLFREY